MSLNNKLIIACLFVAISLFSYLLIAPELVSASTFYYSKTCSHCQSVMDSGILGRIGCVDMCNVENKECQKYSGVPVLEYNSEVVKGAKNIVNYIRKVKRKVLYEAKETAYLSSGYSESEAEVLSEWSVKNKMSPSQDKIEELI